MNGSGVVAIPNGGKEEGLHEELAAEEVRSHLARIFASPAFRASKRCHRFLEYVVTQTLEGKAATLKERTLAVEVFDRSSSWDSGDDTIVRVGAREVRKRLAQFYTSPEGAAERIRIELHSGSYVPEFSCVEAGSGAAGNGIKTRRIAARRGAYVAGASRPGRGETAGPGFSGRWDRWCFVRWFLVWRW